MTLRSRFGWLSEGKEKVNRIKMKCFLKRTSRPGFASFTPRVVDVNNARIAIPSQNQMAENLFFALSSRIHLLCYIYIRIHKRNMYTSYTNKPQQNFSPRRTVTLLSF